MSIDKNENVVLTLPKRIELLIMERLRALQAGIYPNTSPQQVTPLSFFEQVNHDIGPVSAGLFNKTVWDMKDLGLIQTRYLLPSRLSLSNEAFDACLKDLNAKAAAAKKDSATAQSAVIS